MNAVVTPIGNRPLTLPKGLGFLFGAVAAFTLAYTFTPLSFLTVVYLWCLLALARLGSGRRAFYFGLAVGLLCYSFQLSCFYTIFGWAAVALWFVLAFWIGLFVALARLCWLNLKPIWAALLIPFLWTGLEYFRSELYYLRFSWLNVGYAFSHSPLLPAFPWLGMYGVGFLAMGAAVLASQPFLRPRSQNGKPRESGWAAKNTEDREPLVAETRWKQAAILGLILAPAATMVLAFRSSEADQKPGTVSAKSVRVAGVQLEFPTDAQVIAALDELLTAEPEAELLVLSEYTFDGPVPERVQAWCREHRRYLIVGGKDPAPKANFYDTAFVIGPSGEIAFRQVKSVPIQFFADGLPAPDQKLWDSPWGKIGLCICYDLSYTRVTDRLIRLGAQALIVPTMDVVDWGRREHELHACVAPIRAAEYGIPIFRLASSGVSQCVDRSGRVRAWAKFPGQEEMIGARLALAGPGTLPLDRWLAPFATGVTVLFIVWRLARHRFWSAPSV
ncbi:MAG: hypothetical protein DME25_08425 [Verrucomicrobia bacterium]|nr:MAG: hypothetical protein DME25_08425 [Verrucomicrobiota bacterium]